MFSHTNNSGCFEQRMIAILTERYKRKLPLWLSPYQVLICPVADSLHPYAEQVRRRLDDAGFYVDIDNRHKTLSKKIHDTHVQPFQYNYILVLGEREATTEQVSVRQRKEYGEKLWNDDIRVSVDDFLDHLRKEAASFSHHPISGHSVSSQTIGK